VRAQPLWLCLSNANGTTVGNGVAEIDAVDFAASCSSTMFYTASVVFVFGHALLWSSPTKHHDYSDEMGRPDC